jgi:outer membrane protein assembly factor BamB
MKAISKTLVVLAACSSFAITGCASVRERVPFMHSKYENKNKAKEDGRIAVLGIDDELKVDDNAKSSAIAIPEPINLTQWHNSGGLPSNAPQNLQGDGKLSIVFKKSMGTKASKLNGIISPPIIAGDVVYTIDGAFNVRASNINNGNILWTKRFTKSGKKGLFAKAARAMGGGLAYGEDKLFLSSGFGEIIALNPKNGEVLWRAKTTAPVHSAPLYANGRVYAVAVDSVLWALDAKTGDSQWTQGSLPEPARVLSASSSAISGETVVTPFASGEVIASLVANGRKLWSEGLTRAGSGTSLSSINDIAGRPVIHGGVVYAVSQSGILAAIDLRTGTKIWDKEISSIQTPWVAGDFIYIVSSDAKVICVKREDGAIVWISQMRAFENEKKQKNRITWTGPVMVAGHLVLASSKGDIVELNPLDGAVLNKLKTNEEFLISPAYKDGVLYYFTNQAHLVALK